MRLGVFWFGLQPAKAACHVKELWPANRCAIDPVRKSLQPSGRACDAEEQPSARGRLRAAGRAATDLAGGHFHHQLLRAAACEDRQRRQGAAGLRRRRLRPADPCGIDFACGCGLPTSPTSSLQVNHTAALAAPARRSRSSRAPLQSPGSGTNPAGLQSKIRFISLRPVARLSFFFDNPSTLCCGGSPRRTESQ